MSWASDLITVQDGDVIIIPVLLTRKIGLQAAAFLRQAAYLSAIVKKNDGWFFLEQEGPGDPLGATIFERLGSWQAAIGIGPDAQGSIRQRLKKLGLLEETRKGMVHGKLNYRVQSEKYLNFLASCNNSVVSNCNLIQTGNPDCSNSYSGLSNPEIPACTFSKNSDDIYHEEILSRNTTTTTPQAQDQSSGGCMFVLALHWPGCLPEDSRPLLKGFERLPGEVQQQVLDVVASAHASGSIKKTAEALAVSLIQRALRGGKDGFDPTPGLAVGRRREAALAERKKYASPPPVICRTIRCLSLKR